MSRTKLLIALILAAAGWLSLAPAVRAAEPQNCGFLPSSAQRPRSCNPQEECRRLLSRNLKGPAREAPGTDCSRLPTNGTCYGPDTYDPQAECRARQQKK